MQSERGARRVWTSSSSTTARKGDEEDLPPRRGVPSGRSIVLDTTDVHEASLRRALILNFLKYRSASQKSMKKNGGDLRAPTTSNCCRRREPYRARSARR